MDLIESDLSTQLSIYLPDFSYLWSILKLTASGTSLQSHNPCGTWVDIKQMVFESFVRNIIFFAQKIDTQFIFSNLEVTQSLFCSKLQIPQPI